MEPLVSHAPTTATLADDVDRVIDLNCEPGLAESLGEVLASTGLINFELIGGLILDTVECFFRGFGGRIPTNSTQTRN